MTSIGSSTPSSRSAAPSFCAKSQNPESTLVLECSRLHCAHTNQCEQSRVVAQLGSALDWGSRGRRFKSCQPDSDWGPANSRRFESCGAERLAESTHIRLWILDSATSRRKTGGGWCRLTGVLGPGPRTAKGTDFEVEFGYTEVDAGITGVGATAVGGDLVSIEGEEELLLMAGTGSQGHHF